jgi:RNA-directed DNA polymerase
VNGWGQPQGMSRMRKPKLKGKSYDIPKRLLWDAWLKVKENGGAAGADGVTIEQFEEDLSGNLYRLWNRMSSGSYHPGPVRAVEIPKKGKKGGIRVLGIPSVVDRVAQAAAAKALEPNVEPVFHEDSYGYRPGRAPVDAVVVCRERCFQTDWVVDLDIRAFFDSVPWDLMLKAVAHHADQKWIVLYVERWLKAPMQRPDGTLIPRVKGTPQGSPISPCLANLYLHYGLDAWMERTFPTIQFERFADDAVIHCVSESQARFVRDAVARRLVKVGLELHPDKTRIVYCKDSRRRGTYEEISLTFCGYTFRPRKAYNKRTGEVFTGFLPAVSSEKLMMMSRRVGSWRIHRRVNLTLEDLAAPINQRLRGWLAYFTAFYPTAVIPLCQRLDHHLERWARWKYKRLARSPKRTRAWLQGVRTRNPELFAHWRYCGAAPSSQTARAV